MMRLYRNSNFISLSGEPAMARLREISNSKCFYTDLLLSISNEDFFFENRSSLVYEDGLYIHNILCKELEKYPDKKKEIINPLEEHPKHHLYLREESKGISLVGTTQKGKNTVGFINILSTNFIEKINETFTESKKKLIDLKNSFENAQTYNELKQNINTLWRILSGIKKQPLASVRVTALLYHEDYESIKEIIEKTNLLDESEKKKVMTKFNGMEEEILKDCRFYRKKNEIKNDIKQNIESLNYEKALKIATQEELANDIISAIDFSRKLCNNEDNSNELYETDEFKIIEDEVLKGFHKFKSLNPEKTDYCKIIRYLSVGQKQLQFKKFKSAISEFGYFIEYYCVKYGSASANGMVGKFKKAIEKEEANIENIFDTFENAIYASNEDSKWINFKNERNDISHEGKSISEEKFILGFKYLISEVPGKENKTGLANKWYKIFQLPEKNIFDGLNSHILKLIDGSNS